RQHLVHALDGIGEGERRGEVGRRVFGEEVGLAGGEQVSLAREVAVDRRALDACAPGHLGSRRARRTDLLMERGRRRRDSTARLRLAPRTLVEAIRPLGGWVARSAFA